MYSVTTGMHDLSSCLMPTIAVDDDSMQLTIQHALHLQFVGFFLGNKILAAAIALEAAICTLTRSVVLLIPTSAFKYACSESPKSQSWKHNSAPKRTSYHKLGKQPNLLYSASTPVVIILKSI